MSRLPPPPDRSPDPGEDADAREFDAFAQAQDPLDIDAATWAARRRNGLDAAGEAELRAWLAADPSHGQAFEDMVGTLEEVEQLPDSDVASLKAGLATEEAGPAIPPSSRPQRPPDRAKRRQWFPGLGTLLPQAAAVAVAFAVVGGGWMGWDLWRRSPVFETSYATARGQQLSVLLPDGKTASGEQAPGSRLQLDTATQVDASLYRDRRVTRLKEGEAMFTVQTDAERPFQVWAGPLRITVVGTRFSVRHLSSGPDAGRTVVSVEEGRVHVARTTSSGRENEVGSDNSTLEDIGLLLTAGQMVAADASGQLGPVGTVSPTAVAPWREGRLNFDQTPLAQAIAEFERYGRTGLVVRDPVVAAMPVGGSYNLRQWQRFAEALPLVLPVRLVNQGDVTEVVAR